MYFVYYSSIVIADIICYFRSIAMHSPSFWTCLMKTFWYVRFYFYSIGPIRSQHLLLKLISLFYLLIVTSQIKDDFLGRAMIHCDLMDTNPETRPFLVSLHDAYMQIYIQHCCVPSSKKVEIGILSFARVCE